MNALFRRILPLTMVSALLVSTVAQSARGPRRPGDGGESLNAPPLGKDEREKAVLQVLNVMNSRSQGMMSVPRDDGRLLRLLVETIGAKQVVELGTSHGYSGVWMATALQKTGGRLTTFEIDAERAKLAREHFKQAGVEDVITLVEGDAHKEVGKVKGPVDMIFLDADKDGYLDYLNQLLPKLRPGGLVVAHNMEPRMADRRFVEAITTNPELDTVFGNFGAGDISLTIKKR